MLNLDSYRPLKGVRGYVYLLGSVYDPTTVKIGCTQNPQKRLKTLKRELPFSVEYVHIFTVDNMRQFESELHKRFRHRRLGQEMYYLSPLHVKLIIRSHLAHVSSKAASGETIDSDVIANILEDFGR